MNNYVVDNDMKLISYLQINREELQENGAQFDLTVLVLTTPTEAEMQPGSGLGTDMTVLLQIKFLCKLFIYNVYIFLDQATFSGSGSSEGSSSGGGSGSDSSVTTMMPEHNTSTTDMPPDALPPPNISNISVQLPAEVFANVTEDRVGLLYSLYLLSSLFPVATDSRNEGFTVGTPVVGAAVSGRNISNLASPVLITLPITSVEVNEVMLSIQCMSTIQGLLESVHKAIKNWIVELVLQSVHKAI